MAKGFPVMEGMCAEIRLFVGYKPPRGWAFCRGQTLGRVAYASLFRELGNRFGGDGVTLFKLPVLEDPMPLEGAAHIICISGFSSQADVSLSLGEITMFAGISSPLSRLICDGRRLKVDDYLSLFSVIGHQFGGGGEEFVLPDLSDNKPHPHIQYWINVLGEVPI